MESVQNHLPFSTLADFAEGRQLPDERASAHLALCRSCSIDLAWLKKTLNLLQESVIEEPSARAVGEIKAIFRTRGPRPKPLAEVLTALLRFDSARMAPAFALRSSADVTRQLLFSAGPYDVDLRIAPSAGRWTVSGQLLGDALVGPARVEIIGHGETLAADLSPLYEFTFSPLRDGRYAVSIEVAGRTIRVPDVELGA